MLRQPTSDEVSRGLRAFATYAFRELSLDASMRAALKYGRTAEHAASVDALRGLNLKMLHRDSLGIGGRP